MKTTLLILLAVAPIGALDVVYFHLHKFRLYRRRQSRREEMTHLLRGALFPLGLGLLLVGHPEGAWFWVVAALFAIELVNSLVDISLEPQSRSPEGVPRLELVIHSLGATMMGAAASSYLLLEWPSAALATGIRPHPADALPGWMLLAGTLTVAIAVGLFVLEAALVIAHRVVHARRHDGGASLGHP
jgi:hypothetical protein